MKKQLLTIITVIALVVTLAVPSFGKDDGATWDPGGDTIPGKASIFLAKADGSRASGSQLENSGSLLDGCFYIQTQVYIDGANGVKHDGKEMIELKGYNDSTLENVVSMEEKSGSNWIDVTDTLMNNGREFSQRDHIQKTYRIKVKGDVQLSLQYRVITYDIPTQYYASELKYIQIANGNYYYTMYEANVSTAVTTEEPSEETTTENVSTTVDPTAESGSVAPTATVDPTADTSSVVPTTTVDPTAESGSVAPTATVDPTAESGSVAPTATVDPTAESGSVAPTATVDPTAESGSVVPTVTVDPSEEPTTEAPVTGETSTAKPTVAPSTEVITTNDVTGSTTKYQKAKAPGKVKIKKVWKKKKSAKKLKVKVKAVKGAKGYAISVYKNKKNAKKHIKAIVTKYTSKLKYTVKSKKLKNKKKLFVGARAYNVSSDGTKVFGPWAKIKKVKVK